MGCCVCSQATSELMTSRSVSAANTGAFHTLVAPYQYIKDILIKPPLFLFGNSHMVCNVDHVRMTLHQCVLTHIKPALQNKLRDDSIAVHAVQSSAFCDDSLPILT